MRKQHERLQQCTPQHTVHRLVQRLQSRPCRTSATPAQAVKTAAQGGVMLPAEPFQQCDSSVHASSEAASWRPACYEFDCHFATHLAPLISTFLTPAIVFESLHLRAERSTDSGDVSDPPRLSGVGVAALLALCTGMSMHHHMIYSVAWPIEPGMLSRATLSCAMTRHASVMTARKALPHAGYEAQSASCVNNDFRNPGTGGAALAGSAILCVCD